MVDWITITEKELNLIGSFCESQSYMSKTNKEKCERAIVEVKEVDSSGMISVRSDYFDDLASAKRYADVLIAMKKNHKIIEADGDYTLLEDRKSGDELTINISCTR